MSDERDGVFLDAFKGVDLYSAEVFITPETTGTDRAGVNRATVTANYLADLANEDPRISDFIVAEIIEHLHRHL